LFAGRLGIAPGQKLGFADTTTATPDVNWQIGQETGPAGAVVVTSVAVVQTVFGAAGYGYMIRTQANTSLFEVQGSDGATRIAGTLTLLPPATTSGVLAKVRVTPGADTGTTASTEAIDVDFALGRTRTWATGSFGNQRAIVVRAPTYAFVGASSIATAASLAIEGPPAAGANATLGSTYSFWVQAGLALFDGGAISPTVTGSTTTLQSLQLQSTTHASKGAVYTLDSFGVGRVSGLGVTPPRFAVTGNCTVASGAAATLDYVVVNQPTVTVTGATNITTALGFNFLSIEAPIYSTTVTIGAGPTTIPAGATLCIKGPPTITGGGSFTSAYGAVALWVQTPALGGTSAVFDGQVVIGAGASSTGGLQLIGTGALFVKADIGLNLSAADQSITKSGGTGNLIINCSTTGSLFLEAAGIEALRILGTSNAGQIQIGSANLAANGAVATTMTSLGPTGSHTTVQQWLAIKNDAGVLRWLPMY
jgi:hypothetical protein